MKKILIIIAVLCLAVLCSNVMAANTPTSTPGKTSVNTPATPAKTPVNTPAKITTQKVSSPAQVPKSNITILQQDSGTNITKMNVTLATSPAFAVAQAVEFKPPKPGWKLESVLIMATDGWNASSKKVPTPLPFTVEIRDSKGLLLYHFEDTQLPYFTHPAGTQEIRWGIIEVPPMVMNGNFYVCFYGYALLSLLAEQQNATGNSYYFVRPTGQLLRAGIATDKNQTIPVNWLIRAAGE